MADRENLEPTPTKKLKDFGSRRILAGHKNRCPLTSCELVELYVAYLDERNSKKKMGRDEFEMLCKDFKKLIPKSKKEAHSKLQGDGYLCLKEDLMAIFRRTRGKCNAENEERMKKHGRHQTKDDKYLVDLTDDEVGIEDFAQIVCVEPNYLLRPDIRKYFTGDNAYIPTEVCNQIFSHYDANANNWLTQYELMALLRDIFAIQRLREQACGKPIHAPKEIKELDNYTEEMCMKFSTNYDGMLTYTELERLLNSGNEESEHEQGEEENKT